MIAQLDRAYLATRWWKVLPRLIGYGLFEGRQVTTRGRWINPLLFALFSVAKRLPQARAVKKPIYIVGLGRSGTTILGKLLSIHRQVGFLNEPKALWHSIYPHEDVIGNYTRLPARYRLSAADAGSEVARAAHRLYGAFLVAAGASRVVDKYADMLFRVPFVKAIFPDARFLLLIRDGWDTSASIAVWTERYGRARRREDWWGLEDRKWMLLVEQLVKADDYFADVAGEVEALDSDVDRAVVEWVVKMRQGLRLLEEHPGEVHPVRYEELLREPRRVLSRALEFCELPPDEAVFDYAGRVLLPPRERASFSLHPALESRFRETLAALGYQD